MGRGGKRAGAGRKRGTNGFEKEELRRRTRELVARDLVPMIEAQIANAKGIKYLVIRNKKTGKFIRVTEAMARLKSEEPGQGESLFETVEVWEKDPCIQAFTDLANRAMDKPAEQKIEVSHSGGLTVSWKGE